MTITLPEFLNEIYEKSNLEISDFEVETEGRSYLACNYKLNGEQIYCRTAKNTPKKEGQFVTFWKRNDKKITESFHETDIVDYLIVIFQKEQQQGLFIFTKEVLIKNGILSTHLKEGKRGFRVYSTWDITKSKQAAKTQEWQLDYFYDSTQIHRIDKIIELFTKN